jgi:hypothetical protein
MGIQALSAKIERHPALGGEGYNAQRPVIIPKPGGAVKPGSSLVNTEGGTAPLIRASVVWALSAAG